MLRFFSFYVVSEIFYLSNYILTALKIEKEGYVGHLETFSVQLAFARSSEEAKFHILYKVKYDEIHSEDLID